MIETSILDDESFNIKCHDVNDIEDSYTIIHDYDFKIVNTNIRSITKNFDDFYVTLQRFKDKIDIIVLTECWINELSYIPLIPNYKVFRTSKVINKNSGVVVYVSDKWSPKVHEANFREADCLIIEIPNIGTIMAIYRSPSFKDIGCFLADLECYFEIYKRRQNFMIVGDININITPSEENAPISNYISLNAEYALLPAVTLPTREKTCLDHIFVRSNKHIVGLVCKTTNTDHYITAVGIQISNKSEKHKNSRREILKWDYDSIKADLSKLDWVEFYKSENVNTAVEVFSDILAEIIEKHTTKISAKRSKVIIKPWITPGLVKCMRNRDRLHMKTRQNPDNYILLITYKRYRNFCNKLLRNLKVQYEINELQNSCKNPKKLWKTIKTICNIPQSNTRPSELLRIPNCTNHQQSLNVCNTYFATIGKKLADSILDELNCTEESLITKHTNSISDSFFIHPTDPKEVATLITKLKDDKAPGLDGFNNAFVKTVKDYIVSPLTFIFNLSFKTGVFPEKWKTACVTPIFKAGDKFLPDSYRPISLLSVFSKLLEKLMNKRLTSFLESQNLLSSRQFGFRQNKSTNDAVQLLTTKIASLLDRKRRCLGVFLDLAKAFDTVSVHVLLNKLNTVGIRGLPHDWFKSYLVNRRQCVRVGKDVSSFQPIGFGVPQGSILGPTLFLLYLDNIHQLNLPQTEIICYADDTAILFEGSDWNSTLVAAEEGMRRIYQWLESNLLTLNAKKTKFVCFHITKASAPPTTKFLKIHKCRTNVVDSCTCTNIERTTCIKYLGIVIDENLNFTSHISYISGRARSTTKILRQLRDSASTELLKKIYFAICESLLTYCLESWGGAAKTHMLEVERAQRSVLKVMLKKNYRYPTTELYKESQVLNVRQLYIFKTALSVHRSLLGTEMHRTMVTKRNYHISTHKDLPKTKTVFGSRFGISSTYRIYNLAARACDIRKLNVREAQLKIKSWLHSLPYDKTEELLLRLS